MWIVANIPIKADGEIIEAGTVVEVPDRRGERLIKNGIAAQVSKPETDSYVEEGDDADSADAE